jgi:hypothetical protein
MNRVMMCKGFGRSRNGAESAMSRMSVEAQAKSYSSCVVYRKGMVSLKLLVGPWQARELGLGTQLKLCREAKRSAIYIVIGGRLSPLSLYLSPLPENVFE